MLAISNAMQYLPNSKMAFNYGTSILSDSFWSTTFAGTIIGGLSFATLYFLNESLGMSSSLVAASSFLSYPFERIGLIYSSCEWVKSRKDLGRKGMYALAVMGGMRCCLNFVI